MSWYDMAGEACLAPTKPCGGKAKHETDKHIIAQIQRNNVIAI